jgi:hypothetical protein
MRQRLPSLFPGEPESITEPAREDALRPMERRKRHAEAQRRYRLKQAAYRDFLSKQLVLDLSRRA